MPISRQKARAVREGLTETSRNHPDPPGSIGQRCPKPDATQRPSPNATGVAEGAEISAGRRLAHALATPSRHSRGVQAAVRATVGWRCPLRTPPTCRSSQTTECRAQDRTEAPDASPESRHDRRAHPQGRSSHVLSAPDRRRAPPARAPGHRPRGLEHGPGDGRPGRASGCRARRDLDAARSDRGDAGRGSDVAGVRLELA
jgi:hypothetical protein